MEPGMIFRRYYLYLNYLWIRNWRRKDRHKRLILKPLGLCIYCYSVWIVLFFSLVFMIHFFLIPVYIGGTYIFIQLFYKLKIN